MSRGRRNRMVPDSSELYDESHFLSIRDVGIGAHQ